jgi:hypothetical protein
MMARNWICRVEEWRGDVKHGPYRRKAIVVNLLGPLRRLLAAVEVELKARTQELGAAAPAGLPVGLAR